MNKKLFVKAKKARRKMLRNRLMTALFTVLFVLVLATTGFHLNAKATDQAHSDDVKYYTSIVIRPGDSLWSIATEHMDTEHYSSVKAYVKDIAKVNNLKPNSVLTSCEYIVLPYYASL